MNDRRSLLRLALATLAMPATSLLSSLPTRAQQSFQKFFPLLIDLPGWKGGKPDGASVEIPGNSMVTATREYSRGEARLNVQVIIGQAAAGALAATTAGIKIETSEARMSTSTIDGLPVTQTFSFSDKSGAVIVALGPSAMFNVSFNGVAEAEALGLARKFNWKAMQAALPKS